MAEQEQNHPDGQNYWDTGFYETGATRPPKNSGGILALILVAGIVLAGMLNSTGLFRTEEQKDPNVRESTPTGEMTLLHETGPSEPSEDTAPQETLGDNAGELELHVSPTSVANVPQEGGLPLQEIYEKTIDSVVSISCQLQSGTSSGSGVILSGKGYVVTNAHVIGGAQSITVLLTDGREFDASVVGADSVSDLAVLWIDAENLKAAEFGDSAALRVGDAVAAIGDPLGVALRGTMTDGIVSAINRDVTTGGRTMTLIQTNAALNSGNSGGPLLNCYGQVVGINTMKMTAYVSETTVEGLGFAIPSTTVKEIVDQLVAQGYVSGRPGLGLKAEDMPPFYQQFYHFPAGVYVAEVYSEGAAQAGICQGDVILTVEQTRVTDLEELLAALSAYQVGDTVTVTVYRDGRQLSMEVVLQEEGKPTI